MVGRDVEVGRADGCPVGCDDGMLVGIVGCEVG